MEGMSEKCFECGKREAAIDAVCLVCDEKSWKRHLALRNKRHNGPSIGLKDFKKEVVAWRADLRAKGHTFLTDWDLKIDLS